MISQSRCRLVVAAFTLFALAACAPKAREQRVVWPAPPDRPRLEWIKNYYSQDDFPKTGAQVFMEGFLGKPPLVYFARPFGIAAKADQQLVYVSDTDAKELRIFDLANNQIRRLNAITSFGRPLGITFDGAGNLYVCDAHYKSVMVFGPDNQPRFTIGGPDDLEVPAFVEVNDRLGRVYVSDGKAGRVVVFDKQGKKLFTFGELGGESGMFRAPQGMAIDKENRVFVADLLNARVQVFDADGKFLYMFGERADLPGGFEGPKDMAFDSEGNLHIVDSRKALLLSYQADGRLLLYTGGQKQSTSPVGFAMPISIFIDKNDRIYIADAFNMRFSVWQYLSEAYLAKNPIK